MARADIAIHARSVFAGAVDGRLLFQVDSHDQVGMMWGDVGRLGLEDLIDDSGDLSWFTRQCGETRLLFDVRNGVLACMATVCKRRE